MVNSCSGILGILGILQQFVLYVLYFWVQKVTLNDQIDECPQFGAWENGNIDKHDDRIVFQDISVIIEYVNSYILAFWYCNRVWQTLTSWYCDILQH